MSLELIEKVCQSCLNSNFMPVEASKLLDCCRAHRKDPSKNVYGTALKAAENLQRGIVANRVLQGEELRDAAVSIGLISESKDVTR